MKRALTIIVALLSLAMPAMAQMTESQIRDYVLEEQAKGTSQEQIVMNLNRRGVTMQQLQQMRQKYEASQSSGIIGNTIQTNQNGTTVRSRTLQNELQQKNSLNMVSSLDEQQAERTMTEQERLQVMYSESMFMFTDSIYMLLESLKPRKQIYGHDLFKSENATFQPSLNLATPQNYKLGPGDEVIIDVWGSSQMTVQQIISPDGNIVVENIGPVYLNGLTVQQADKYLKKVFSEICAGLDDDNGDSSIKLSLGQNRSIQINVMGDVVYPGTYTVSSFATILNALYMAGGVSDVGTLRDIKVYRQNKEVSSFDLYDYLMNGKVTGDIRLEDNDVVMVPAISCLVTIDGRIRRPMYYEMKSTENVADLIKYAGGMESDAYRKDVRLIRMGGVQREIYTLDDSKQKSFLMADGDSVYVDSIMATYSNMAEARGAFYRPGMFQVGESVKTVRDLIQAAGGLREEAFLNRALLNRTNPDKTLTNLSIDLDGIVKGTAADVELRNGDVFFVPTIFDIQEKQTFSIFGEVQFPGTYTYADNTQIEDLIIQAGGLKESASVSKVDVVRRKRDKSSLEDSKEISETFSFSISEGLTINDGDFRLQPFDDVYIRKSPAYIENQRVMIEGEVLFPGYYSMSEKGERLSDIVLRSGNFTSEAYPSGARLQRTMTEDERLRVKDITKLLSNNDSIMLENIDLETTFYVGIDLQAAVDDPDGPANIELRDGDRLIVPKFSNTVKMNGEVMYSNTVSYMRGKNLKYYIDKAGGYGQGAKKNKAYVVYMNGTVAKAKKHSSKLVQPGCEIIVPKRQERDGLKASEILSLSSTSASLATVVLALINLIK